jgi:predicted kinase
MNEKFVEFISEGVNDPGIFKAVFLAGGPGSGKSFMAGRTGLQSLGLKAVNPDHAFEAALRTAGMEATPENIYSEKGQSMRLAAKRLTTKKQQLFLQGRLGMVIDGTGKDISKIERQATMLQSLGYDIAMIFVNTDLETALERNSNRSRTLPDNIVKRMWNDVQNNMGGFQRVFKQNMTIVDNNSDSNVEKNTLRAYKDMQQFVRAPVRNHKAREWITNAQKQKMREEALEELESMIEDRKYKVAQDPDIKDRKSSQPAHYHKGLEKGTKVKRDSQFQKQAKMADDNPKAYKFAPGDKEKGGKLKKTKPSKYTKYVDKMMSEIVDEVSEACWDTHKQKGMKKKGGKLVPNCVPKNEEAEERDSMTLPKIGKMRNVSKRVSKQRTKNKVFDKIKVDQFDEITMSDRIKAKTLYKKDYQDMAQKVLSRMRKDKMTHGGKSRHSPYFHAGELLRGMGKSAQSKYDSKILGGMVEMTEEYKYEWGTPEGTAYMKAVTPGEPGKTTKKNKTKTKNHYKAVMEEDGKQCEDGMYYCRQRKACTPIPEGYKDRGDGFIVREEILDAIEHVNDLYSSVLEEKDDSKPILAEPLDMSLTDEDIRALYKQADNLTVQDMIDLGMYDEDEFVEYDVADYEDDIDITEALTPLGRIKRRQAARRNKQRLKVARARAMRKSATPDKIKMRATRGARGMMYKRLLRGRDKGSLPPAEKARLEVMIKRFQPLIARIAVRMVPQMRKNELNRLKKRGAMTSQKAKKFKIKKGGNASKYKAKKFKIKKAGK